MKARGGRFRSDGESSRSGYSRASPSSSELVSRTLGKDTSMRRSSGAFRSWRSSQVMRVWGGPPAAGRGSRWCAGRGCAGPLRERAVRPRRAPAVLPPACRCRPGASRPARGARSRSACGAALASPRGRREQPFGPWHPSLQSSLDDYKCAAAPGFPEPHSPPTRRSGRALQLSMQLRSAGLVQGAVGAAG